MLMEWASGRRDPLKATSWRCLTAATNGTILYLNPLSAAGWRYRDFAAQSIGYFAWLLAETVGACKIWR